MTTGEIREKSWQLFLVFLALWLAHFIAWHWALVFVPLFVFAALSLTKR